MNRLEITATIEVTEIVNSVGEFKEKYPESHLTCINGTGNFTLCEGCGKPIFAGQNCFQWNDEYTCLDCGGNDESHKSVRYMR